MNARSKTLPYPLLVYIAAWAVFLWLFICLLSFRADQANMLLVQGMYFISFGVHEAAHIVFGFLPAVATAAAGSLSEIVFALLLLYATVRQRAYFAAVFACQWVMLACISAGNYMADARSQLLPLIGPGETVQHDWNFVFGQLGWLNADTAIGGTVHWIGVCIGAAGLLAGVYKIGYKLSHAQA